MTVKQRVSDLFKTNPEQDIYIDVLRAVSVLMIIIFHIITAVITVFPIDRARQFILDLPFALHTLWHFEKGVDVFFLLSGLSLGVPLLRKIEQFNWSMAKQFYIKRFFRIYPLFLFALILYTLAQFSYSAKYFFSNLFFIDNLVPDHRNIIPVGWSLTMEMQFYFFVPFFLFWLKKTNKHLLFLSLLFLSSFFFGYLVLELNPELYVRKITDMFWADDRSQFTKLIRDHLYASNLLRFGTFVAGFLLAYIKVYHSDDLKKFFQRRMIYSYIALFVAVVLVLATTTFIPVYDPQSWYYQPFNEKFNQWVLLSNRQFFIIGISLFLIVSWYTKGLLRRLIDFVCDWKVWLIISRLAFPIYLFHFPMIGAAALIVYQTTNIKSIQSLSLLQGSLIFLLATALTVLISIPMSIWIESIGIRKGRQIAEKIKS